MPRRGDGWRGSHVSCWYHTAQGVFGVGIKMGGLKRGGVYRVESLEWCWLDSSSSADGVYRNKHYYFQNHIVPFIDEQISLLGVSQEKYHTSQGLR